MTIREWGTHKGATVDEIGDFHVIECEPCGFRHITPLPTEEDLSSMYQHDYYDQEKPLYLQRCREDLEWWRMIYLERLELLENLLPHGRRSVLDVGSGPGFFLQLGKERGWSVLGIEPSRQASEHSKGLGLDIIEAPLSAETLSGFDRFDVIHMSNVLEHVPDPKSLLGTAHRLLRPGGLICVIVPNDYNILQGVLRSCFGQPPWWVSIPYHINYFNFASLGGLLDGCGFQVLFRETTFPMELFLLSGENYVQSEAVGRACHKKRMQLELNLFKAKLGSLKRDIYRHLASLGIGRECIFFSRKPPE